MPRPLQGELLDRVRALLENRGKGEQLEVFNHEKFPKFSDVVQYFSNEVSQNLSMRLGVRRGLRHECAASGPCMAGLLCCSR